MRGKQMRPNTGFVTRGCFNRHEVQPQELRAIEVGRARVLVCSEACAAQARARIGARKLLKDPHLHPAPRPESQP